MISPEMTEPAVTVFEAINNSRREIFVGATPLTMSVLIARFRAAYPPELSRWSPQDDVEYRSLEFGLDSEVAAAFIKAYTATVEGWRIITEEKIRGS